MPLPQLLNNAINETLSRTTLTSVTTILALLALVLFGGEVIRSFTAAMLFGVVFGTYSSIFIAAPLLILFRLRPGGAEDDEDGKAGESTRQGAGDLTARTDGRRHRHPRGAFPRTCADRGLWQWRLPLRRHVASRLAAVPAVGHLWLGAEGSAGADIGRFRAGVRRGRRRSRSCWSAAARNCGRSPSRCARRCARQTSPPIRWRQVRPSGPSTCCSPRTAPSPPP